MKFVAGGELDKLKKEFAGYTKYGLLDEIRKLREQNRELKEVLKSNAAVSESTSNRVL